MPYRKDINIFKRDVWCILGLPFDAVNMDCVIDILHTSVTNKTSCFISTPNLNFLVASQTENEFRNSVINSDLSVVDGKPIVWIARLLNIPIPERVAGASLIEELIKNKTKHKILKVFFFGGEEGIAEIACEKLSSHNVGLECVGSLNPGFGSIENMSADENIDQINQSNADFVIVSIGAKKGQDWIEKNRNKLNAPIISNLGAVVNFIAGTVNRSPKILQNIGLEWLWRIKEEPSLWRRYFNDSISFLNLLVFRVLPLFIIIRTIEKKSKKNKSSIEVSNNTDSIKIELGGYWGGDNIIEVNNIFQNIINSYTEREVEIIIKEKTYIDASFVAKILMLRNILLDNNRTLKISANSKLVTKIFRYNCCEYLL